MTELLELARADVPKAFRFAAECLDDAEQDPRLRLEAAKLILSYGLGRPPVVDVSPRGADGEEARPLGNMSVKEAMAALEALDEDNSGH